jgi:hypothetical protein
MPKRLRHIAALCLAAICLVGCDGLSLSDNSGISIEQVSPDTIRADEPTTLTITGTGFDGSEEVRFSFKKRGPEIDSVRPTNVINSNTLEVVTPVLPRLDEKTRVWIAVVDEREPPAESDERSSLSEIAQGWISGGSAYETSNLVAVTFRPPNIIDLYGMYALAVIGGVAAVWAVLLLIRRGYRRMAFRNAVLEAKGRRLALRDERHANAVLEELAAEKRAEQAKLEAEYLPYADQASGKGADE